MEKCVPHARWDSCKHGTESSRSNPGQNQSSRSNPGQTQSRSNPKQYRPGKAPADVGQGTTGTTSLERWLLELEVNDELRQDEASSVVHAKVGSMWLSKCEIRDHQACKRTAAAHKSKAIQPRKGSS